jgi:hypothetical protein
LTPRLFRPSKIELTSSAQGRKEGKKEGRKEGSIPEFKDDTSDCGAYMIPASSVEAYRAHNFHTIPDQASSMKLKMDVDTLTDILYIPLAYPY